MQNNMDSLFLSSLREMLACCKEIQMLLRDDKNNFSQNNLNLIDSSNQKKVELLNKLNSLTHDLDSRSRSINAWASMRESQGAAAPAEKNDLRHLMQELKSEILACYKYISVNSSIVFANLQQMKDLRDKLLARKPKEDCTYNDKGSIK